jgi:hypothetical protein
MYRPCFSPFLETQLFSDDVAFGSAKAAEPRVLYDVLARGIPAMSYCAAANPLPAVGRKVQNFNMEEKGRDPNSWPTQGHSGFRQNQWIHSDFKSVALPYVSDMYYEMIKRGELSR